MTSKKHQAISVRELFNRCTQTFGGGVRTILLDLDGTLFFNNKRTLAILKAFAQKSLPSSGNAVSAIQTIKPEEVPYGMSQLVALLNERGADLSPAQQEDFKGFWQERFFTDEWQKHDEPAPGAVDFVHALLEAGVHIVYLTGRDIPNMRHGVVDALLHHGFPVLEAGASIICKPTFHGNDREFKHYVVDQLLLQHFNIVALVDNEPPIVNMAADCSLLGVHFTGSTWAGQDPLHEDAVTLASFVL